MIWRQSSEPIEPAAPVTATTLPATVARTCSTSIGVCSRPRRSSASTMRRSLTLTLPFSMTSEGMMRVVTPASAAALRIRRTVAGGALGSATRTCSISSRATTRVEVAGAPDHLHAADGAALQGLVVVQEADGGEPELRPAHDLVEQERARAARAHDQHAGALARLRAAHVHEHARGRADARDAEQHDDRLDEQDAEGDEPQAVRALQEVVADGRGRGSRRERRRRRAASCRR